MGTENVTIYGNRLLAEFMGAKKVKEEDFEMPHGSNHQVTVVQWTPPEGLNFENSREAKDGRFKYDKSWDWLFTVINKIESLGYSFVISREGIQIWNHPAKGAIDLVIDEDFLDEYVGDEKLMMCMSVCVSFVELYNNKKLKTKTNELR